MTWSEIEFDFLKRFFVRSLTKNGASLFFSYSKLNFNSIHLIKGYVYVYRGIAAYNYAIMEKIDLNTIITEAIYSARTNR